MSTAKFPIGAERYDRLESLLTNITYSPEDALLSPGKYNVTIDMNELADEGLYEGSQLYGASDILFPNGYLNPTLQIVVSFNPISDPEYDWFFYREEDIGDSTVENRINWDFFKTNVQNRGVVLEFSDYNGDVNAMYPMYAVPMFVKITSDETGDTNTEFSISGGVANAYSDDQHAFSVWSGFAGTLGDGCSDITDEDEPLPFRLPDTRQTVKTMTSGIHEFKFEEYEGVLPNEEVFLETIMYVPMASQNSGQLFSLYFNKDMAYTKAGAHTGTGPLSISDDLTDYKLDQMDGTPVLKKIFEKIESKEICVYLDIRAAGKEWMMYWNTEKISEDLADVKTANVVDPSKMCSATPRVA